MATLTPSLRRRAVYAVLAPVLDDEALIAVLWLQQDQLRGDSVTDIIRFIDRVAELYRLDVPTRRLYEQLHQALRQPESALPLDPLPLMQASAPAPQAVRAVTPSLPAAPTPGPPPVVAPAPVPVSVPVSSPAPLMGVVAPSPLPQAFPGTTPQAPAAPDLSGRPAVQVVHAGLMRSALAQVRQYHPTAVEDLRSAALAQVGRVRVSGPVREAWRSAWEQEAQSDWLINAPQNALAELVNTFYVALCEALGPVDADHVLTRAVREAEGLPQAREFSPRRFV